MSPSYVTLLHFPLQTSDRKNRIATTWITEKHIQVLWLEQKFFTALHAVDEATVEVISPGIWNADAGPDFLKAHLIIAGQELKGDVEIHVNDQNWYHHCHECDPRYNAVILHISLWLPQKPIVLYKANGHGMRQLYLEKQLKLPLSSIVQTIDLDLYPYKQFLGSGVCAHELYQKLPTLKIQELFRAAALWRLEKKWHSLQAYSQGSQSGIIVGIAMALGYKNNAATFLQIFLWLQQQSVRDFTTLFTLALGSSGFFESVYQEKWLRDSYYRQLLTLWQSQQQYIQHRYILELNQVRPVNHPVRRLAALIFLLLDATASVLEQRLQSCWMQLWPRIDQTVNMERKITAALMQQIPIYTHPYWNKHYTFGKASTLSLAFIGPELQREILVNVLLPFLQTEINQRRNLVEQHVFQKVFASIPASTTGKSRYLTHRFFGDGPKNKLIATAQMQQGAYQIHHDFCLHYEASCRGCPFVKNYSQNLAFQKKS